jgi:hypothetical protein
MKKMQQIVREQIRIKNPTIGTAITTPRFRFEWDAPGVVRERLDGRRDWVKILVGAILKEWPVTVLKWQL